MCNFKNRDIIWKILIYLLIQKLLIGHRRVAFKHSAVLAHFMTKDWQLRGKIVVFPQYTFINYNCQTAKLSYESSNATVCIKIIGISAQLVVLVLKKKQIPRKLFVSSSHLRRVLSKLWAHFDCLYSLIVNGRI